jgi:hypothetical protein
VSPLVADLVGPSMLTRQVLKRTPETATLFYSADRTTLRMYDCTST